MTVHSHSFAELGVVSTATVQGEWTVQAALEESSISNKPVEGSESPVPFIHILERLKTTKREGWRRFGITYCESISDHMYRMAIMAMILPASLAARVDQDKCIKMALIHDMAELLVGDITPVDGVPKLEKSRRESQTMDYLTKTLLGRFDGGLAGKQIREIWQEYEDSKTFESIVVHDLDKLELLHQMVDYEKRANGELDLGEFTYVATKVVTPEINDMAAQVLAERKAFWENKGQPSH
ncbi:hypothetical protein Cpir12675_006735 [Ceratocystis pirilliformis]|uniref:5'-deoxynucleotidase n=1 Tax=Ceratocystis pirilliformis TaxID=259994 RepID=A0ABR3YFG7_9PEZI